MQVSVREWKTETPQFFTFSSSIPFYRVNFNSCNLFHETVSFTYHRRNVLIDLPTEIKTYLSDLFWKTPDVDFIFCLDDAVKYNWIRSIEILQYRDEYAKSKDLECLIENNPNLRLVFALCEIVDYVEINSNILQIQNLISMKAAAFTMSHVYQFKGKNAVFANIRFDQSDIITLIDKWMNREIPALKVHGSGYVFEPESLDKYQGKQWSESGLPNKYPFDPKIQRYLDFEDDMYHERSIVITRDDGKLASVFTDDTSFFFWIWH
ncbi:hypothetical protein GCK72_000804 [Caenorhabditis remanei]|uniref:F-box associated domain-containing protein n=1 Tax=Caenorhabditis remanei TaxID=31234 RepID=A0A6A5HP41_CAERE|nr:hypothetical protein GCK72_000804 [Caenorhabditis remanei]KAF1768991.1 hypothetical protein GCK72_000804 [Caenorhabditis remanei]